MTQRDKVSLGSDPRSFILASVSLGLVWGWTYLYSINIAIITNAPENWSSLLALMWKISLSITLLFYTFSKRRITADPRARTVTTIISATLGILSTVLLTYYIMFGDNVYIAQIISLVLFGISYGLFLCCWIEKATTIACDYSFLLFNIGLSCVIASMTYLIVQILNKDATTLVLCILPAIGWLVLYRFPFTSLPANQFDTPLLALMPLKRILLAIGFISLSLGISCQVAAAGPMPSAWVNGSIIAGVLLCAVTISKNFSQRISMYFFALVIFICGCLAFILPFASGPSATTIIRIASFITMANALALSAYYRAIRTDNYGALGFVCYVLPLAGGEALWIGWKGDAIYLLIYASIFLALAICIFLYKRESVSQTAKSLGESEKSSEVSDLEERVARLSSQYNLSTRETEILLPLSKGYSLKTIAQAQGVSINTIKSQVRSVYSKLNIHAKEDLIEIIDAMNERSIDS